MVAELQGTGAVNSMRLKLLHGKVDRASQWGVEREILLRENQSCQQGKADGERKAVVASIPLRGRFPR